MQENEDQKDKAIIDSENSVAKKISYNLILVIQVLCLDLFLKY